MSSSEFAVTTSNQPLPSVEVSAQVVFSILNSYSRRTEKDARVFGALLGEVSEDGVVHVTECFAVPVVEDLQENRLTFDTDYYKSMYAFHLRNNKRESVVGWYATSAVQGAAVADSSSWVNGFFAAECAQPVHLVVDTALSALSDTLAVHAFVSRKNIVADVFHEVSCTLHFTEAEAALLHHMIHGQREGEEWASTTVLSTLPSTQERIERSVGKLDGVLAHLQSYVDGVVEGRVEGDREVGVALSEALSSFSQQALSSTQLQLLNSRYQDLVMISYLSTLAQSQASVAEKLNQII